MKNISFLLFFCFITNNDIFGQQFSFKGNNHFGMEYITKDSTQSAIKLLFYDLDADGDQDVIVSGVDIVDNSGDLSFDKITYFIAVQENIGDRWHPKFDPRRPFMNKFPYPNGYFFPAVGDLNHDSKPDFIVSSGVDSFLNLQTLYYERKSLTGDNQFNIIGSDSLQLNNLVAGSFFVPELADMDKDGDLDLLLSGFIAGIDSLGQDKQTPIFMYAKNIGSISQPKYLGWYQNPYGLEASIDQTQISIVGDIDNDNDNDMLSLTTQDTFKVFSFLKNDVLANGKPHFQKAILSPFGLPKAGQAENLFPPSLVDIDSDGDLDLFVVQKLKNSGEGIGYYENNLCISSNVNISQSICWGDSLLIGNQVFKTAGVYTVSLENMHHCDSTIHLNLAVRPTSQQNTTASICQGKAYSLGNQAFTQTGQYQVTLSNINGCDSTVNLNLTVFPNVSTNVTETLCSGDSFTIGNQTFTQTGQYQVKLSTKNGCDSIINLNLTIPPTVITNITKSGCLGYAFVIGNQTFTQTGQYQVKLSTVNGCDSIINLNLTIHPLVTTDLTKSLCAGESFAIGNQTFTQSGKYEVKLQTIFGCDSIVNAILTFIAPDNGVTQSQNTFTANITGAQYQWFDCISLMNIDGATGQSYAPTKSGKFSVKLTDSNGCKSVSACYDFVITGLEIQTITNLITIYPNPTDDYFTILNNTSSAITGISILNSEGLMVKTLKSTQSDRISTSGLSPGNYIIEIRLGEQKISKKLILTR